MAVATRPLLARFVADATRIEPAAGSKATTNGGRWRLNAGSEMVLTVPGVNQDAEGQPQPFRGVLDLESVRMPGGKVPALRDHDNSRIAGNWSGFSAARSGLDGDLTLYEPKTEAEGHALCEAVQVKAMMDQGHPWQASIGATPEDGVDGYELADGDDVIVNGSSHSGAGALPLYVIRGARVEEGSIVLWGADPNTGRIAASRVTAPATAAKDSSMDKLKALMAKYPAHKLLVAEALSEGKDEVAIAAAVVDADMAALRAKAEAAERRATEAEGKLAAGAQGAPHAKTGATKSPAEIEAARLASEAARVSGRNPGSGAGAEDDCPYKSWGEARRALAREHKGLKGSALNALVAEKYPSLDASDFIFPGCMKAPRAASGTVAR